MRYLTAPQMVAFVDELRKTAGWSDTIGRVAKRGLAGMAGSGHYGTRMAVASGAGALAGGAIDDENRLRGALIGGGIGAAGMGGAILATEPGRKAFKTGAGKWWKRQRYGLTGTGIKDQAEAQRVGLLQKGPKKGDFKGDAAGYKKALEKQKLEGKAYDKGLYNLPGMVKGMVTHPIDTLKSGWRRSHWATKGMAGLGAYEAGKGFIEKPKEGEPGRIEKGLRTLGNTAGMVIAPPAFLTGSLVSEGLGQAGKWGGRGIDRLSGRPAPTKPIPEPGPGGQVIQDVAGAYRG